MVSCTRGWSRKRSAIVTEGAESVPVVADGAGVAVAGVSSVAVAARV